MKNISTGNANVFFNFNAYTVLKSLFEIIVPMGLSEIVKHHQKRDLKYSVIY